MESGYGQDGQDGQKGFGGLDDLDGSQEWGLDGLRDLRGSHRIDCRGAEQCGECWFWSDERTMICTREDGEYYGEQVGMDGWCDCFRRRIR